MKRKPFGVRDGREEPRGETDAKVFVEIQGACRESVGGSTRGEEGGRMLRVLGAGLFTLFISFVFSSCAYDPGVAYYQPAPVYTRPAGTYTSPPPPPPSPSHYYPRRYYSPQYVPPRPPVTFHPHPYRGPTAIQFYYRMPYGASYVRMRGNPCWLYNGHYYRRNPRGAGFVLFIP